MSYKYVGCSGLTSITIPNGVTSIGWQTFYGCSSLTSVIIPNSVTSIGDRAFYCCRELESLFIPKNVASIGDNAFQACLNLTSIQVENGNAYYDSRENCNALIETQSNTLIKGCNSTIIIPASVTSIGSNAFGGCSGLTSLTIPNSVTSIGDYAFDGCSGLTSLTIPNSIASIGDGAFWQCKGLLSVTIPNSVTKISPRTFEDCVSMSSVIIPNSVTSIGEYGFNGCSSLSSVISEIKEPFAFDRDAFRYISSTCTLTVPYGTRDAYIASGWTEDVFKGGIVEVYNIAMDNYLSIEDADVCKGKSIVLPVNMSNTESVTALQFEAFLPDGVTISKCQLTDRKGDDHAASYRKLANGNYQVTVFSGSKAVFGGTEGAVLNLTLDVNKDMPAGEYPISLTNIELTTAATQAINPADVSATLTVSDVKIGDTDGNGRVSITDAVAIVSHILGDDINGFVAAAADVDGNGRITITDAVAVVDMILSGTASAKMRVNVEDDVLDPQ